LGIINFYTILQPVGGFPLNGKIIVYKAKYSKSVRTYSELNFIPEDSDFGLHENKDGINLRCLAEVERRRGELIR
jgi:hypothetical protein